jgi:glycosyltransferase involved in cell wall biosynthesis
MSSLSKISCIIPFWNEGKNVLSVIDEVLKVGNLAEIICVDDGSDDDNSMLISIRYPEVKLIRLQSNQGKAAAVREGLKFCANEFVLLIDADIRNLNHKELEKANDAFLKSGKLDMIILRRVNALFFIKFYRADILFTGERILRKCDLEKILEGSVNRWQLESAINYWMFVNRKKVAWVPHSGINTQKSIKWGKMNGFKLDMKTYSDMISATGFSNFMKQVMFFAKDELKFS